MLLAWVIFSCRKDQEKQLHFDTRQYPHILWEKSEDLYAKLSERIGAVIGEHKAESSRCCEGVSSKSSQNARDPLSPQYFPGKAIFIKRYRAKNRISSHLRYNPSCLELSPQRHPNHQTLSLMPMITLTIFRQGALLLSLRLCWWPRQIHQLNAVRGGRGSVFLGNLPLECLELVS